MKRTYISPEFTYTKVEGTFNMLEERTFFGSKMLEVEDEIIISDDDIIYYQKTNEEQENLIQEKLLPPIIYSSSNEKAGNHELEIDESQTEFELLNNSKWILTVNLQELLRSYVFAQLKSSRVFEGVLSDKTRNANINQAIFDYIDRNVTNRYEFSSIRLYLKYNDLTEGGNFQSLGLPAELVSGDDCCDCDNEDVGPGGVDLDSYFLDANGNVWDVTINQQENIESRLQSDVTFDKKTLTVKFNQSEKRQFFNYNYYFDIIFRKA